jgi:methyl acetate hydrolase
MIAARRIDHILNDASDGGPVAGAVAIAANGAGVTYQGAAGKRLLGAEPAMTLDTVFLIASMTKAVTAVAAMQLVEQGRLGLDEPLSRFVDQLAAPQVLEGFDERGAPRLRLAKRPVTLRHLLTHTAGYTYEFWSPIIRRYMEYVGIPGPHTGHLSGFGAPLVFDPGERAEYSISLDWAGRIVEAVSGQDLDAYFRQHLFDPLEMPDTGFVPTASQVARGAGSHFRNGDGVLTPVPFAAPHFPDFYPGGGGLFSTGPDYIRFLRALLNGGALDGARILKPETVALMGQNHIGALNARPLVSADPVLSKDFELFPDVTKKWGLSFQINMEQLPTGRSAGSLAWAGMRNTYFWIDPAKGVTGLLMTQILPFGDAAVLEMLEAFETEIYRGLAA